MKNASEKRGAMITLKTTPEVKAMAQANAQKNRRSLSNYIECLIIQDNERQGGNDDK